MTKFSWPLIKFEGDPMKNQTMNVIESKNNSLFSNTKGYAWMSTWVSTWMSFPESNTPSSSSSFDLPVSAPVWLAMY